MNTITMQDIRDFAAQHDLYEHVVQRWVGQEAFLRRAALVDGPFMLKGSHVTSQQIAEGWRRQPGDLDWVGLGELNAGELNAWATAVTETAFDDGIRFDSFSQNAFWRNIDYAMDEDFPTVNTTIDAWIGEHYLEVDVDVSFGLDLRPPPQQLLYQPRFGSAFMVGKTVPIVLQMAWKLHQCLLRPRFKDLMDIILVLRTNKVDANVVWAVLEAECRRDGTPVARFNWLLDKQLGAHPSWARQQGGQFTMADYFAYWRTGDHAAGGPSLDESRLHAMYIGGPGLLWSDLDQMLDELARQLEGAGFAHVATAPNDAPTAEPASMSARLWGLLGRRP